MSATSQLYRVNNSKKKRKKYLYRIMEAIQTTGSARRWKLLSVPYMLSLWNKSIDNILYLRKRMYCHIGITFYLIWNIPGNVLKKEKKKRGRKSLLYLSSTVTTISYNFCLGRSFLPITMPYYSYERNHYLLIKQHVPSQKMSAVVEIYEARWTRYGNKRKKAPI